MANKYSLVFTGHKCGSSTIMAAMKEAGYEVDRGYPENINTLRPLEEYDYIVVPVRDPVARSISLYFEVFGNEILEKKEIDLSKGEVSIPGCYLSTVRDAMMYWWNFDFGAEPFNTRRGWNVYYKRFLFIQTERLSDQLHLAIWELTREDIPVGIHRARTEDTRAYGPIYKEFLEAIWFDEEELDRIYSHELVQYFYSQAQIKEFKERWKKKRK